MNFLRGALGAEESSSPGTAGLSGWLTTLQDKAKEIGEVYKRDLGEFATTVKKDAGEVIEEVIHEVKEGSDAIIKPSAARSAPKKATTVEEVEPKRPSAASKLAALNESSVTYSIDPSDKEAYQSFLDDFDAEARTPAITELLKTNAAVEALHKQMVPEQVPYKVFWSRYFFRLQALQLEDRKTQLLLSASDNLFGDDDDLTWDDEPESSEKPPALASNEASKQQAPGAVQNALACAQEEEAGQGEPGDIIGARGASRGDQEAVEMGQESSRNEAEGKGAGGGDVGRLGVSDGKRQDLSKAGDEGAAVLSSELRSDASSSTYVVSMPTSAEASLLASVDNASTGSSCSSTSAATSAPAALRAGDEGDAVGEGHAGAPEKVPAGEKGADARKEDEKKADDDWDDWE